MFYKKGSHNICSDNICSNNICATKKVPTIFVLTTFVLTTFVLTELVQASVLVIRNDLQFIIRHQVLVDVNQRLVDIEPDLGGQWWPLQNMLRHNFIKLFKNKIKALIVNRVTIQIKYTYSLLQNILYSQSINPATLILSTCAPPLF